MGALEHESSSPPPFKSFDHGVWHVVYENSVGKPSSYLQNGWGYVQAFRATPVARFFNDIYSVDPYNFILCVLSRCVTGLEQSVLMFLSAKLLSLIETGFTSGVPDKQAIFLVLALRIFLSLFVIVWRRWSSDVDSKLETQVKMFFQEQVMRAHCADIQANLDINNDVVQGIAPPQCTSLLFVMLQVMQASLSTVSQLLVLLAIARTRDDGMAFVAVCLARPVYSFLFVEEFSTKPFLAYVNNRVYERMTSMWKIAMDPVFAKEIAAYSLGDFLVGEYQQARLALRGISDRIPYSTSIGNSFTSDAASELLNHLPLLFVATNTLLYSRGTALSSILVIEQTSFRMRHSVDFLFSGVSRMNTEMSTVKSFYVTLDAYYAQQDLNRVLQPYPLPDYKDKVGMEIELRNVSLQYPGAGNAQYALRNVSFTIKPSSLVVIVGQNGSGKSSLVKLFTGLCHPNTGEVLIDGVKASFYRREDLAQGTALLTQDHKTFPLSMSENIGLGDHPHNHDMGRIWEAAALGGASDFINKLPGGYEHTMTMSHTCLNMGEFSEGPLQDLANDYQRCTDISGGERQRLSAARTFMRLLSQKTKLVVVDEPTSAVDPVGEYQLFERLRTRRAGRTMVLVSHRFGHLTKFADQILCMKDGELAEAGTHDELMALHDGEYRKLYDAQASAFREHVAPPPHQA